MKKRKLTPFENRIRKAYTGGKTIPYLTVDHQTFRLTTYFLATDTVKQIESECQWTRDQLAIALARLIENEKEMLG